MSDPSADPVLNGITLPGEGDQMQIAVLCGAVGLAAGCCGPTVAHSQEAWHG
jgi:hypothetical protein